MEFAGRAAEIAREAGALLRGFYAQGVATEYKGDVDLVTEADRASEALIRGRLQAAFPTHGIYGEEGTREGMDAEFRWYVDPLDGTTNFAHQFPVFCVVLGCERRRAGLEANGGRGDGGGGDLRSAAGRDVFCRSGAGCVAERAPDIGVEDPAAAGGVDGDGISFAQAAPESERAFLPGDHAAVARGAAGRGRRRWTLAYVACGRLDGFWEFNLNPWDTSAGVLLVREAGGRVTHFDGGAFTLDSRETLATNGLIAPELQHIFAEMFAGRGDGARFRRPRSLPRDARRGARSGVERWREVLLLTLGGEWLAVERGRADRIEVKVHIEALVLRGGNRRFRRWLM